MAAPTNVSFPVSTVITVSLEAPGPQLGVPNLSALAIITALNAPSGWASGQTYGVYNSPAGVAADWGSASDMTLMATAIFSQSPNILSGNGYLVIIPRLQTPSLETVQACLIRTQNQVFYAGFLVDSEYDSNQSTWLNLSNYVQSTSLLFFYATSNIANLATGSYLQQATAAGNTQTRWAYYGNALPIGSPTVAPSGQTQIFAAAYAGRGMSVNFSGVGTMLSMQLQSLATITPDQTLTETTYLQAQAAGADVYVSVSGIPCVLTSGANLFFDQIYGRTWLKFQLQVNGFNYLKNAAQVPGKIPQTETGMTGLKGAYIQAFQQGISNGYLAPGSWQLPFTFGDPVQFAAAIQQQGYYIVSQPVASQTVAQLQSRVAPLVQAAVQEAGALQSSSVIVEAQP